MKNSATGFRGRMRSFGFAVKGLKAALKSEPNLRIHFAVAAGAVLLGLWLQISFTQWALVCFAIGLVLITELLNTAIETMANVASPGYHKEIGKVKDIAAGAVLIAACTAALVGGLVFLPKLYVLY